jgi:glycosyltransferase involved in cell wall biosynthesis
MKHILILGSYAPSLLNFRGPFIRELVATGHRVSVGAPDIDENLRRRLEQLGARVIETKLERNGSHIFSDLRYHQCIFALIKRLRPNLVLTYTIKPNIWGAIAAWRAGVPSYALVTGLGFAFSSGEKEESIRSRSVKLISRRLYRLSSKLNRRVIFQNPDDRADFIALRCLKDDSKTGLVDGSGVDLDYFARSPLPSEVKFLMIARLLVSKGVLEYVEAANTIRKNHPQARFLLVGPLEKGFDSIAPSFLDEWVQDGVIEYRGALDDIRSVMSEATVYVLPSYREGTPRTVLEAMAMGRAIVTTDAPGCRETIRDGEEGFLIEPRNAHALAVALERFILEPDLAWLLAEKAYKRAQKKYDVRRINSQMMVELDLISVI